jgi:DNA-binding NarL/FixJ family response regulator
VVKKASAQPLKVCLLSSHPLVLRDFERALVRSGMEAQPKLQQSTLASVLRDIELPAAPEYVLDASLPPPSMEALVGGILLRFPKARVLVVAEEFTEDISFSLLRLGVKGPVTYQQADEQLPRALLMLAGGGFWVPREILSRFLDSILQTPHGQRLKMAVTREVSPREQQTLDGLLENLANKEIAAKMNISERTVKFHVSNLLAKYGVQRRADLILMCYQRLGAAPPNAK